VYDVNKPGRRDVMIAWCRDGKFLDMTMQKCYEGIMLCRNLINTFPRNVLIMPKCSRVRMVRCKYAIATKLLDVVMCFHNYVKMYIRQGVTM